MLPRFVRWLALGAAMAIGARSAAAQGIDAQRARPQVFTPAPGAAAPSAPSAFVVVLDAAHGGDDPGSRIGSLAEKDIALALSVRLRSLLASRAIPVVTTRESDAGVTPQRRAEMANHAAARACLLLHASQTGSGVHMYVSSLAPTGAARVSAWKTAQSGWVARSLGLQGALNSALMQAGVNVTLGRTELPSLDSLACPAVAVELAPPAGRKAEAGLDDPAYQAQVANALAAGLLAFKSAEHHP